MLEKYIKDTLIAKRFITKTQLSDILEEQARTGKPFAKLIIDLGVISSSRLIKIISKQVGMEPIVLKGRPVENKALSLINRSTARLYHILPFKIDGNTLDVAVSDPFNPFIFDDLRFMLNMNIRGYIASEEEMEEALDKYYGNARESMDDILNELSKMHPISELKKNNWQSVDISSLENMAKSGPIVKLLNLILVQAISDRASDIHFEPFEDSYKVRYRVDGALCEMTPPPKELSLAISSRIKVMANMNIAERRVPQDGRIQLILNGRDVELRISTLPTTFGESIVMRVLDKAVISLDIEQVGMNAEEVKLVRRIIKKPHGIIIVTGPTGAGKTTTLYSCIKIMNKLDTKIITTEDPVEYDIDGVIQAGIRENIGFNFAMALRHILRQDPDKIMVGEIRDLETARMAVQSSLTGHLVLSTLHTNDAPESITRLIDMGVEPFLVVSTLEAIIAQRLVRRICNSCKERFFPTSEMLSELGLNKESVKDKEFFYGKGCSGCNYTGYKGRTGIFEILLMTDTIKDLILKGASTLVIRQKAEELGMHSLRDSGLEKIYQGITTIEEVAKVT